MDIDDLRRRLFGALASSLAVGCGPAVALPGGESGSLSEGSDDDDSTGSVDDGHGTHSSADAGTTTGATTSAGDDDVDDSVDDGHPKFDVLVADVPPDDEPCVPQPEPPLDTCTAPLPPDADHYAFLCVELPADGDCGAWAVEFDAMHADDPSSGWTPECLDGGCSPPVLRAVGCGPLPEYMGQCCFWFVATLGAPCPGRPFLVAGHERLADPTARADWAEGRLGVGTLPRETRSALADVWAQHALFEHASIASFSRFVLHLLACGAPADLVLAANVALGEEIQHAQLFFGFASHYAGAPVGPTALDVRESLSAASLAFDEIVLSAVREGCIAETISAWHVSLAAHGAADPAMASALEEIATQELDHAVLAWRFLDWAWARADDDLRARIMDAFARAETSAPRRANSAMTLDDATLLAHGLLPAELHASAMRQALREVVAPAAHRFFASRGAAQARLRSAGAPAEA
jgi:hypothetical protein